MSKSRQREIRRVAQHDLDHWRSEMKRRVAHLAALTKDDDGRPARLEAERERVASDFDYWLANYGWMSNPKADVVELREMPFVPWPKQLELSQWYDERVKRQEAGICPKSREVGVTWWFLHRFLHSFLFEDNFSALLGSRKRELVDKRGDMGSLFQRLRYILAKQPDYILTPRKLKATAELVPPSKWIVSKLCQLENLSNGSMLVGESRNPDFGRGKRYTVVLIDEYAAIEPPIAAAMWRALDSVSKAVFAVWNPGSKGHITYELHKGPSALDKKQIFELNWRADPRRSEQFKEDRIRPRGPLSPEDFEQEYECKYGTVNRSGLIYDAPRSEIAYGKDDLPTNLDVRAPLFGCWDFGSGPSLLCCLLALYDSDTDTLWIEHSLTWSQTKWTTAAADAHEAMRQYGRRDIHFGDPAGIQRDSEQSSWEANLRAGGIPIFCLPGWANKSEEIEWGFKLVQNRLDSGKLRVSREARYLWQCLENWQRNVPDGVSMDYVSRDYLSPRSDVYSHGGMALCYFALGIDRLIHKRKSPRLTRAVRSANTMRKLDANSEGAVMEEAQSLAAQSRRDNLQRVLQLSINNQGAYELPAGHPELKRRAGRRSIGSMARKAMGIRGY